jgi:hypothetical protein
MIRGIIKNFRVFESMLTNATSKLWTDYDHIRFKDNLSFIYITMDSIRTEIEAEIKRARLDKGRLYDLLLKIIDNCGGSSGSGGRGPQGEKGERGPAGPAGPAGPQGPAGVSSTKEVAKPAPKEVVKPATKEVVKPAAKPAAKKTTANTPAKKKAPVA